MPGMDAARMRRWTIAGAALIAGLVTAAPAHAVATIAADTTRAPLSDPLASGRSTVLVAGGLNRTLLRFRVQGLGGPPSRAVLRVRVTDATTETLQVRTSPAFTEDDGQPALLLPSLFAISTLPGGAKAGTWAQWDVTSAVKGNGDVNLQVSGPLLDPASFSSREGPDAPQLVVTPDEPAAARLAGLLDPGSPQASFVAGAHDDLGRALDGLDAIESPPGLGVPGRYVGVSHSLLAGRYVTQVATSDDLLHWTHRADLAEHATQATLEPVPGGGFLLAFERDTPDVQYISKSNLVIRHYASWAALLGGAFTESDIPRTLAATAEGTPSLEVKQWGGTPQSSQILVRFHYLKNIDVDRQAQGTLTNFSSWNAQPETAINDLFVALGTRGNLGDRADVVFEGHRFAVLEAQSIKTRFDTWKLVLV